MRNPARCRGFHLEDLVRAASWRAHHGGGCVFDAFDSYAWMFIGSFGFGLGAVAIALMFPPLLRAIVRPA